MGTAHTTRVVQRGHQLYPKEQVITVEIRACPVRLAYDTNVRREGPGATQQKELRLVEVRLLGTKLEPWLLLTDWPVTDEAGALHVFCMYRQRWAVEESFQFFLSLPRIWVRFMPESLMPGQSHLNSLVDNNAGFASALPIGSERLRGFDTLVTFQSKHG